MKAVMISIQPQWCELILSGKKTLEVRKTRPKLETPFKCYIYCTLAGSNELFHETLKGDVAAWNRGNWADRKGNVIGEFVCDYISIFRPKSITCDSAIKKASCLTVQGLIDYAGNKNHLFGWHISDLKIYDKPKMIHTFHLSCPYKLPDGSRMDVPCPCDKYNWGFDEKTGLEYCLRRLGNAPQSWCYVEELR